MPPKKRNWGDIPNINHVKEKDEDGKWIECCLCNIRIRVRSQFCLTEWSMHCSGTKHCNLADGKDLKNVPKMTSFFQKKHNNNTISDNIICNTSCSVPKKRKIASCPGFYFGKNLDLVPLYSKYKKKDLAKTAKTQPCHGDWNTN